MDFARKQLEKYGWTKGKGLGKNENGISEALKPKIKRSVTGIGHNAAEDFTEHWWTALYNKAAENVELEQRNGKCKKIKTKDDNAFEITNSTWKLNKKQKNNNQNGEYQDFFVKTEILGNAGMEKLQSVEDSESECEDSAKKDIFKLTDEELFAACGGRTAHKGARFGLKATGKLARIKEQEEKLLDNDKYRGYSHAKNRKSEENSEENSTNNNKLKTECNIISNDDYCTEKKGKKRKKHNNVEDNQKIENYTEFNNEIVNDDDNINKIDSNNCEYEKNKPKTDCNIYLNNDLCTEKKSNKKKKHSNVEDNQEIGNVIEFNEEITNNNDNINEINTNNCENKKKYKKKKSKQTLCEDENNSSQSILEDNTEIKRDRKKCKRKNKKKQKVTEDIEETKDVPKLKKKKSITSTNE